MCMGADKQVYQYYNQLAKNYDSDRFENTYGSFLHRQEEKVLLRWLPGKGRTLNLCCGTGRFMELADEGLDFSEEMIGVAKGKYPNKKFVVGDAAQTGYAVNSFDAIFCLHAIMHLSLEKTSSIFSEAHRTLQPGGIFVFDFPSKRRRELFGKNKSSGWHGASAHTVDEITAAAGQGWEFVSYSGVLFLPVHRIPVGLRKYFAGMDRLLCSLFKNYSSYTFVALRKK